MMLYKAVICFIQTTFLMSLPVCAQDSENKQSNNATSLGGISEEKFVLINGSKQWVTIKGNPSKPVILFLHGGPGSPISPYSHILYKEWEQDFIIVQWDQRGTGKTYGVNAPEELSPQYLKSNPLSLAQMTSDGIELSKYLIKKLGKKKILLFGTSWGSVLGVKMATKEPALFYAYVGHSQVVDPSDDGPMYHEVYQLAQASKDVESLKVLDLLGKPPYNKPSDIGKLLRIVKKYEGDNSEPPPDGWFTEATGYENAKDRRHRSDGDDYSFVNYVGDKRLGVGSLRSTINFLKDHLEFKVPVYLIQGSEDLLTPAETTKAYFDKIKAPYKQYFLLPNTAHGFNLPVLETQYNIFKSIEAF